MLLYYTFSTQSNKFCILLVKIFILFYTKNMNLKKLRELKNISQRELGRQINVAGTMISRYERGDAEPNIETLIRLADFFNVSVDTLIGHDADLVDLRAVSKSQRYAIEKLVNSLTDEQVGEIVGHIKTFK